MFHDPFKTKENFLRALLQQTYAEMFVSLAGEAAHDGTAIDRLRAVLIVLARCASCRRCSASPS